MGQLDEFFYSECSVITSCVLLPSFCHFWKSLLETFISSRLLVPFYDTHAYCWLILFPALGELSRLYGYIIRWVWLCRRPLREPDYRQYNQDSHFHDERWVDTCSIPLLEDFVLVFNPSRPWIRKGKSVQLSFLVLESHWFEKPNIHHVKLLVVILWKIN